MDASIRVYTFKEGLLSKLAHDLLLSLTRFEIGARGRDIEARVEPAALRVRGVMRGGKLDDELLSSSDKEKIQETVQREVLRTREYPEARFKGSTTNAAAPFVIEGNLTLCGQTRPLRVTLNQRQQRLVGEVEIVPSRWGVKPYRALGGTLKVQDRVVISIDASAEWLAGGSGLNPSIELTWTHR